MRDLSGLTTTVDVRNIAGEVIGTREVVLYRTLLDLAHSEGVSGIVTEMLQAPAPANGNTCIFRAEVVTEKGRFTGVGDADPENVDPTIAPHFIRAAETRAKARALRDALNIGVVTLEEILGNGYHNSQPSDTENAGSRRPASKKNADKPEGEATPLITEAQRKFLFRLLAEQGLEGNDALNYLLDECRTDDIKRISRKQASRIIAKLKGEKTNDDVPF